MALTDKQAAFVREFLVDGDPAQAAVRAGYSPVRARRAGRRLLGSPEVDQALRAAQTREERAGSRPLVRPEFVVDELVKIVRQEGEEGAEANRRCANKLKALELLGRHLDLFSPPSGAEEGVEIRLSPQVEELAR